MSLTRSGNFVVELARAREVALPVVSQVRRISGDRRCYLQNFPALKVSGENIERQIIAE